jgi:hypothetical protein
MRYPRLVSLSILAFTVSLVLSGCSSSLMSTNSPAPTGANPTGAVPTVIAVGEQVNGVAPNRKQEVQFSEAMDPATINAQSFQVTDSSGRLMQGTVIYDAEFNMASFLPNPALQTGATYKVTITTAVASTGGMHLASAYTYAFTTRSDSDTSPLIVNSVVPAANATCVSATAPIIITFDETPDASTVNSSNIVVTGPGGVVIPVTMSINVTTTQVVITPKSPLPSGTITVTVKNVGDLADVLMAAPYTWSFSTGCGGSATYFYVGVEFPQPAIRGYQVNVDTASLTDVPGSPFAHAGAAAPGAVIVNRDFVYATSTDETTLGGAPFPSGTSTVWVYHADGTSGTLAQVQTFTMPLNAFLYFEPGGHNSYEINGNTIFTQAIHPDGTVTDTGSSVTLPGSVNSVAVSPDGTRMYATVITGSASPGCNKGPCPTTDVIWEIDRDPATGTLTLNHAVSGTENLHLGKLRFDASGSYLLGQSSSTQISVESVNHITGDLTSVPGSPFTSTAAPSGQFTRAFEIDPSGKFVYAVNSGEIDSNSKYISVFSLSQATGALAPVQTLDMTPSADVTGFIVDQSLVFVVNWPSSGSGVNFVPASINVFKRDPVTGFVSAGGSPVVMQGQERLQNAAVMHYQ